jgi:hypothetical protein
MSVNAFESSNWTAAVTFVHTVILLFLGVGSIRGLLILPLETLLVLAAFSFLVFVALRFMKPTVRYLTVYGVLTYSFVMMSAIQLLIYLIIWLPVQFVIVMLLVFFGSLGFAFYLATTGLSHRFGISAFKVAMSLAASFIIFVAVNLAPHIGHVNLLYMKLKGF